MLSPGGKLEGGLKCGVGGVYLDGINVTFI